MSSLLPITKTKDQKEFLIKTFVLFFVILATFLAILFELRFQKAITLEGVIHPCQHQNRNFSCTYLETQNGNFLITAGTLDKVRQTTPLFKIYGKKVKVTGKLSRQKEIIANLGELSRFQIHELEFLE